MRLLGMVLSALLLLCAPAVAAERWRAPQTVAVASGGVELGSTDVAIDSRGTAVAVWSSAARGRREVVASRASDGRRFGRPVLIRGQRASVDDPRVAFDGDRNAVIVFRRAAGGTQRIASRTWRPNGLTVEQLLSSGGASAFDPLFARIAGGRPLVSWRRSPATADDLTAELAQSQEGGRFSTRVTYALPDRPQVFDVAGGPEGERVLASIARVPGTAFGQVQVGLPQEGSTDLEQVPVSSGERTVREIAVVVTRAGRVVVAWTENHDGRQAILVSDRPAGGTFSPPRQLLAPDRYVGGLTLVASGQDTARAAWITAPARTASRLVRGAVNTAKLGVGGSDGAPRDVSPPDRDIESFAMAADGRGGVTIAWVSDKSAEPGGPLEVRAITAQGGFGRAQRLTSSAERAASAALGVGPRGDAAAVWTTAGSNRVRISRRPN